MNETRKLRMKAKRTKVRKRLGIQKNKRKGNFGTQLRAEFKQRKINFNTDELNKSIEIWFKRGVEKSSEFVILATEKVTHWKKALEASKKKKKETKPLVVKTLAISRKIPKEELVVEHEDFGCKVGYPLHQQEMQYGKERVEYYFGGYINDKTIAIVVDNVLGSRAYSSTYYFQVEKDLVFDLPGLYNDGTRSFKNVLLKVIEMNPAQNTIRFEKLEK